MSVTAEVRLWGKSIAAVYIPPGEKTALFEYDKNFIQSGIQISPITMPLSGQIYSFPELSYTTFHGLPGLLADSLPDKFGNAVIDAWLARQGRSLESFNAVERLCYTGKRGMGALEFVPVSGPSLDSSPLEISELVSLAGQILKKRTEMATNISADFCASEEAVRHIIQVGTSAGGARAKAVVAWNPETNEIRSGQTESGSGFEYWLIKFDGVGGNKDKEKEDPAGFGKIEYAYYLMAQKAGIKMSECRLLHENGRSHFMTKRFDRTSDGRKIHVQTLGALAHYDFNLAGSVSYGQVFRVMQQLRVPSADYEQFYRRMVFNILYRNQDDHVKNIAFLMDKRGNWKLSPAYDVTYSYNPGGAWTGTHQMTLNGKRDGFSKEDCLQAAAYAPIVRGRNKRIFDETENAGESWMECADKAGVPEETAAAIRKTFLKL